MSIRDRLVKQAMDACLLFLDGFDDCIIGAGWRATLDPVVVYDRNKIITTLARDMSVEEAEEYCVFNIECAWAGDRTPILCEVLDAATPTNETRLTEQITELARLRAESLMLATRNTKLIIELDEARKTIITHNKVKAAFEEGCG